MYQTRYALNWEQDPVPCGTFAHIESAIAAYERMCAVLIGRYGQPWLRSTDVTLPATIWHNGAEVNVIRAA